MANALHWRLQIGCLPDQQPQDADLRDSWERTAGTVGLGCSYVCWKVTWANSLGVAVFQVRDPQVPLEALGLGGCPVVGGICICTYNGATS